ncbi:MAG TPA: ABC transporter permease [Bryobacteraceae bacterium]|nr:ABC transporter permease [Bryobacteraceae bacterium]
MPAALAGVSQDLRYGVRALRKSPGFACVAILTLALGIGANTAIFHVLDSVLLRSLPLSHPDELVLLTDPGANGHAYGSQAGERTVLAYWEFQYLRDHADVFSGVFAADTMTARSQVSISRGGALEQAKVRLVSGAYFQTLGIHPALGRTFGPEADQIPGGAPFAVISFAYWERRFASNPSVLGASIWIHQTPFQIAGVAPAGFFGETVGNAPDLWIPITMANSIYPGWDLMLSTTPGFLDQQMWLEVMARRKAGVTPAQAQAHIDVVTRRMTELALGTIPGGQHQNFKEHLTVRPGAQGSSALRKDYGEPLRVLMALVGLVLLIACANAANLLLARGAVREKEFALRLAVGAGRNRAIRQLLVESLLLAVPGAIAGFLIAQWAGTLLVNMVSAAGGRGSDIQLNLHSDIRTLLFTALITVLTAVLFGLTPTLRLSRLDLAETLKATSGSSRNQRQISLGTILVVAQVAMSLLMLVATGMFVRSLVRLGNVDVGFTREHLIAFSVDASATGAKGPAAIHFHQQLLQRLVSIPGIGAATLSANGVFEGNDSGDPITVEGYTPQAGERMATRMDHVGPGYFSAIGAPILLGREIGSQDSSGERGAVINQAFARHFFPNTNPLGKHVVDTYYPANPKPMIIVGVAADSRSNTLRDNIAPRIFAPYFQPLWQEDAAYYEVRSLTDPATVTAALRRAVADHAPALPPIEIDSVTALVYDYLGKDRLIARLSGAFGALAMVLASIGLYGVMSWTMSRRTREIGVRMALGAKPGGILRLVLRETLVVVSLGIAIGIPLALAATRLIRGMLYGAGAADPLVMIAASALLIAVATLAGYLPAWRASRVDPMVALRHE